MALIKNYNWYQTLHIFYIINIKNKNLKINEILKESLIIPSKNQNENLIIKQFILQMEENPKWIKPNKEKITNSTNQNINKLLEELNKKLKSNRYLKTKKGITFPVIIYITDSNQKEDYISTLNNLRNNYWYKNAYKIGIALDNANVEMLVDIIGSNKTSLKIKEEKTLKNLIDFAIENFTSDNSISGLQIINKAKELNIINNDNLINEKGKLPEVQSINLNIETNLPF